MEVMGCSGQEQGFQAQPDLGLNPGHAALWACDPAPPSFGCPVGDTDTTLTSRSRVRTKGDGV